MGGWAMANEDHVARLKQGVAAWNEWRAENENVVPDLSGADLRGAERSIASPMKSARSSLSRAASVSGGLRFRATI